ncbi:MAG: L-fucose mutarotase [Kiritimatiellia bacterium]
MLKGIDPVLSPELLKTLCEMGHGDEIVFADAHFPAAALARKGGAVHLRADGIGIPRLLKGLAPLFELDGYATPVVMMAAVEGDVLEPATEAGVRAALGYPGPIARIGRDAFYARAKSAHAIVATGDVAPYGNVILKKGNRA